MSFMGRIKNLFRKKSNDSGDDCSCESLRVENCEWVNMHSFNIRKNGKVTVIRSIPITCNKTLSSSCRINCPEFSKAFNRDEKEFCCPHANGKYVFRNIIDNREVGNNFTEIKDEEF